MQKSILLLCFLSLMCIQIFAQDKKTIHGTVTDSATGEPLIGASVVEPGTTRGTITDVDGNYRLEVIGDKVVISYVGYNAQTQAVTSAGVLDVKLSSSVDLEEIIVVGYGTQRKSDLTGALSSITNKDIKNQSVANVSELLAGKAAGVFVAASSGQPGASSVVRIRGLGTVNDNNPLYVVDGQFMDNINNLNPSDIERIEILKDASSLAIYGSRGSNGVIIVTTKRGESGKTIITLDATLGAKSSYKALDMMDGEQFYNFILKSYAQDASFTNEMKQKLANQYNKGYSTNWWDEVTRTGFNQNYNLGIRKGTADSRTTFNLGYLGDQGPIITTKFDRISLRLNQEYDIKDRVTIGGTVNIAKITKKDADALPAFEYIQRADPLTPVINPLVDPSSENYDYNKYAPTEWSFDPNPVSLLQLPDRRNEEFNVLGNIFASVKLIKGLTYRMQYSFERNHNTFKNFIPIYTATFSADNLANQESKYNKDTKLTNNTATRFNQIIENRLNYDFNIGESRFATMFATTYEKNSYETINAFKTKALNNSLEQQVLDAQTTGDQTSGTKVTESIMSYLGRINYSYSDKYLLTVSFRADGSSKYAANNRWGYYPAASVGWRVSNEEFFKNLGTDSWLSDLKVRLGWGRNGNQRIPQNSALTLVGTGKEDQWVFGDDIFSQGYYLSYTGNKDVKWEISEQSNLGFDMLFFNNRLSATLDLYIKNTKDMLLPFPLPSFGGYTNNPYINSGSLRNVGAELSLNYRGQIGKDFEYNVGTNLSTYKTKVTGLNVGTLELEYLSGSVSRTYKGDPFGKFWGYKHIGIFQNQAEIDSYVDSKGNKIQPNAKPGDFKFAKLSGDGELNDKDRTFIGDPNPDLIFGFNLGFAYKNVDLSMAFQGTVGNDIWNTAKGTFGSAGRKNSLAEAYTKAWTQEGDDAKYPRMTTTDSNENFRGSSFYVEDGSFIRLQNMQIGYTLPQSVCRKTKFINSCRIFFTGQNLFTLTNYTGLDPELGVDSPLNMGYDNTRYPSARTVSFGVNLEF